MVGPKLRLLSAEYPASRLKISSLRLCKFLGRVAADLTQPSVILEFYIILSTQTLDLGTSVIYKKPNILRFNSLIVVHD